MATIKLRSLNNTEKFRISIGMSIDFDPELSIHESIMSGKVTLINRPKDEEWYVMFSYYLDAVYRSIINNKDTLEILCNEDTKLKFRYKTIAKKPISLDDSDIQTAIKSLSELLNNPYITPDIRCKLNKTIEEYKHQHPEVICEDVDCYYNVSISIVNKIDKGVTTLSDIEL